MLGCAFKLLVKFSSLSLSTFWDREGEDHEVEEEGAAGALSKMDGCVQGANVHRSREKRGMKSLLE